jgi:hypothetical protein
MADFRRCILALAVVALLTGLVSTASAQPFTCNATAAVPTLMRSEGLTELAGDIVLQCNGTLPAGSANFANLAVFLGNTTITSRILNATTNESEVLLLLDEPNTPTGPAFNTAATVTVGGVAVTNTNRNVFQGTISGNQVQFLGVPVYPGATVSPGTVLTRVFRITNIRANASAVGVGASGTPGQVTAFVSIVGPTSIPVNNAQQTVGFVQRGLNVLLRDPTGATGQAEAGARAADEVTFAQCAGRTGNTRATPVAAIRFAENFATAFRVRGTFDAAGNSAQTVPGSIFNTESGLFVPGLASGTGVVATNVGVADFGTRLRAVFTNIPNGVTVFVSNTNIINDDDTAGTTALTRAALVGSQTAPTIFPSGVGVAPELTFRNQRATNDAIPVNQVAITGGAGEAVWEVTAAQALAQEFIDFYVYFGYTANPGANSPAVGTGTVAGTFAPVSTVATASATAPIPRFADTPGGSFTVIGIVACRTNLLFPFVTNQVGFDTGIAIANTTRDIFGTTAQAGTCSLNFFGDNAPAAVTTASIAGGTVFAGLAQSLAPNFQGYVIAQCNFQFAHGFAFVSDVGARNLAMGYLALVIPDQLDNTRARNAVSLANGNGEVLGQ